MTDPVSPLRPWEGGARLAVRIIPRARKSAVEGIVLDEEGRAALRIRLAAPPVDGAANAALLVFLADGFGVRGRDVSILSGQTGRTKMIGLAGDPAALAARLTAWIASG